LALVEWCRLGFFGALVLEQHGAEFARAACLF